MTGAGAVVNRASGMLEVLIDEIELNVSDFPRPDAVLLTTDDVDDDGFDVVVDGSTSIDAVDTAIEIPENEESCTEVQRLTEVASGHNRQELDGSALSVIVEKLIGMLCKVSIGWVVFPLEIGRGSQLRNVGRWAI